MRVLVVEDDGELADAVSRNLRREGIAVDVAGTAADGLQKVRNTAYDVVVLDRDLAGGTGDDVCLAIATDHGTTRVLMLAGQTSVDARVSGLALGADDYLVKPFSQRELTARLRALYRRATPAAPPVLSIGDVALDPARRSVTRAGRAVRLTHKETSVLETLMMADGAVVSGEDLLLRVWDDRTDPQSTVVRVTMMNLRRKLGPPAVIHTVVRGGYRV